MQHDSSAFECLWPRLSEKHLRVKMLKPHFVILYSRKLKLIIYISKRVYSLRRWILITGNSEFGLQAKTATAPLWPLISLTTNKKVAKRWISTSCWLYLLQPWCTFQLMFTCISVKWHLCLYTAELVKDFKCVMDVNRLNCSWIPTNPSLNLTVNYRWEFQRPWVFESFFRQRAFFNIVRQALGTPSGENRKCRSP